MRDLKLLVKPRQGALYAVSWACRFSVCLAFSTSFSLPCASSMNLPALTSVSYSRILFFGMPMLTSAAPRTLSPPKATAPSNAPTSDETRGPAISRGPKPGMVV